MIAMPYKIKIGGIREVFLKLFLVALLVLICINNISFIQKVISLLCGG
jgi:hypothetical protein